MFVNASNNAVAKLSSNINSSQTSLTVDDASIFPDAPFLITVNDEIMRVTRVSGNTLTVQRGREGTSASSHNAGSNVENNFTAGTYQMLAEEVKKMRDQFDNIGQELWTGELYPREDQTLEPRKKLSECVTGWVLRWQRYTKGEGVNQQQFQYTHVPKSHNQSEGRGMRIPLHGPGGMDVTKYIYVYDDRIEGFETNDKGDNHNLALTAVFEY